MKFNDLTRKKKVLENISVVYNSLIRISSLCKHFSVAGWV